MHLVVGRDDPLLAGNECFYRSASAAGNRASLTVIDEAAHQTLIAPRIREGARALREILATAGSESPARAVPGPSTDGPAAAVACAGPDP